MSGLLSSKFLASRCRGCMSKKKDIRGSERLEYPDSSRGEGPKVLEAPIKNVVIIAKTLSNNKPWL